MDRSNLVAVRRADRTGRVQTRWVKGAGTGGTGARGIPAPSAPVAPKAAATPEELEAAAAAKRLRTKSSFSIDTRKRSTHDLSPALRPHLKDKLRFTATDDDFYAVLEHFTLTDTLVLMHAEPNIARKTREVYAEGKRFNIESAKNGVLVAELRRRGIPAKEFLELDRRNDGAFSLGGFISLDWCTNLLDVAEYSAHPAAKAVLREARAEGRDPDAAMQSWGFYNDIKWNYIKLTDLKAVGMEIAHQMAADMRPALMKIAAEESRCTATELREFLPDASPDMPLGEQLRYAAAVRAAIQYGAEYTRSIRDHMTLFHAEGAAKPLQTDEERMAFLSYYDSVAAPEEGCLGWSDDAVAISGVDALEVWGHGIPADAVREGLAQGMSAQQIIAVNAEGVASSVSDGWL